MKCFRGAVIFGGGGGPRGDLSSVLASCTNEAAGHTAFLPKEKFKRLVYGKDIIKKGEWGT